MRVAIVVAACAAFSAASTDVQAQVGSSKPLPAFTVTDGNGARIESRTFAPGSRAVLIYVRTDCRPCEQALHGLGRADVADLAARLIVIVGGADAEQARDLVRRVLPPELASARWYLDSGNAAWNALDLTGVPVTMGIDGERIEWTLAGAGARGLLESILRSWLEGSRVSESGELR